jgi:hypothetical protein
MRPTTAKHLNEDGTVLVYTLLILTILMFLVGVLGIRTTYYELNLAGNDKAISRLKIKADSTVAATIELLEKQSGKTLKDSDWNSGTRLPWYSRGSSNQFDIVSSENKYTSLRDYIKNTENWIYDDRNSPSNCALLTSENSQDPADPFNQYFNGCRYQVINVEISEGSSLETGNNFTNMHNLLVTGLSTENQGKRLVQVGFRKRF